MVAVASYARTVDTTSATSLVANLPAGVADGDLLLSIWQHKSSANPGTLTPPGALTAIADNLSGNGTYRLHTSIGRRVASGEPSTYTYSGFTSEDDTAATLLRITGANASTPINVASSEWSDVDSEGVSPSCPSVTTTVNGCLIIYIIGIKTATNLNAADAGYPSGTTGLFARQTQNNSGGFCHAIASEVQATAGATGTKVFTNLLNTGGSYGTAYTIAIAPAAGGGAAALAGDATAAAAAAAALTTAIQNAGDVSGVATGSGALTTAIQTAGDAQSIATAAGDLSTAIQLLGAAQVIATASAGLVSWVNVNVASPYTGPGSIFDDRYWTGAPPANGDVIAYEDRGDGFVVNPDGTYSAPVFGSWLVQYFNGTWTLSEVSLVQSDFSSDASARASSTGDLLAAIQMAAAAAAVATVAAALDTGIPLSGDAQAVAAAAGDLLSAIQLGGDAQAVATAAADLYGAAQLAGDALSQSTSSGDITAAIVLLGAAQSIAAAVGDITTMIQLSGDVQSTAVASGSLDAIAAQLQGDAQAIATAQGDMSTDIPLAGDATALSVAAGAIDTAINLLGAAGGVASADAQLVGSAADLVGAADSIATVLADLTTISFISGDAQGNAGAQGSLDVIAPIFANAGAIATAAADLSNAIRLLADAVAVATAGGDITALGPVVYPPRGRAAFGRRGIAYGSRRPPVLH